HTRSKRDWSSDVCSSDLSKIYTSFVWTHKPIVCDKCGAEHRITISGRFTFVFLTIVPMLIFTYFLSPFSNILVTLGIGFFIVVGGSLLTAFCVNYKVSFCNLSYSI